MLVRLRLHVRVSARRRAVHWSALDTLHPSLAQTCSFKSLHSSSTFSPGWFVPALSIPTFVDPESDATLAMPGFLSMVLPSVWPGALSAPTPWADEMVSIQESF